VRAARHQPVVHLWSRFKPFHQPWDRAGNACRAGAGKWSPCALNVRPVNGIRLVALATPKSPEASRIGSAEQLDRFPGMPTVKPAGHVIASGAGFKITGHNALFPQRVMTEVPSSDRWLTTTALAAVTAALAPSWPGRRPRPAPPGCWSPPAGRADRPARGSPPSHRSSCRTRRPGRCRARRAPPWRRP
jgi:hypothetical protein